MASTNSIQLKHVGVRHIERLFSNVSLPPTNREEIQRVLANMYIGNEMASIGKKNVDSAKKFLANEFDIPSLPGSHHIVSIKPFDFDVKISNPRKSFDKDEFISRVAAKYNITKSDLYELADDAVKHSSPPTSYVVSLQEDDA